MEEVFGLVYLIQNQINGKRYVGKTTQTLEKRMTGHFYGNLCVDKAIEKYGIENFRYGVIKTCATEAELNDAERHFIAMLHSKVHYGYNISDGGEGTAGTHHTPETCAKISAAHKGKKKSPETCAKLAAANLGKIVTAATSAKLSAAKRNNSPYKNLIAEMDAHQLSYHRLAKLMGIARGNLNRKIRGLRNFTDSDKAKLVEIFGKPIEYLLERETVAEISNAYHINNGYLKNLVNEFNAHQLTYEGFAKLLGLSYSATYARIRGEQNFKDNEQARLVEIFGKPIEYLLKWEICTTAPKIRRGHSPYKNLENELEAHQLTYEALGKLLGLSKSNVSVKMRGERNFTDSEKTKLVEIFGKPIEYLLARDE